MDFFCNNCNKWLPIIDYLLSVRFRLDGALSFITKMAPTEYGLSREFNVLEMNADI